jgi:hypothetical protein
MNERRKQRRSGPFGRGEKRLATLAAKPAGQML